MTSQEIIDMAREATDQSPREDWNTTAWVFGEDAIQRFAALVAAAERNKVAAWMIERSYATGPGDTTEDLLNELEWQIAETWTNALAKAVEDEREACAKLCEQLRDEDGYEAFGVECATAIRARREK